jgi:hypothetical protein
MQTRNLPLLWILCALLSLFCMWACAPREIFIYDSPFTEREPPDGWESSPPIPAFAGADFENGLNGAAVPMYPGRTAAGTHVYDTSAFKNGGGSLKIDRTGTDNQTLYYSPALAGRGTRDTLTFWVKGRVTGTLRLFLTVGASVDKNNFAYDFVAANSESIKVEGTVGNSTVYSYLSANTHEVNHSEWAKYVLLLAQNEAYSAAAASIQLRHGALGQVSRLCQMNFDDFMWEDSGYTP